LPSLLATGTIARGCQNGTTRDAKYDLAALASDRH
jgi:hypothetical protein